MNRRDFITLLGSTAAAWPFVAYAQQAMAVIGWLDIQPDDARRVVLREAFNRGLGETGFAEGQNVTIDYRSADFQLARLPALADDFVRQKVAVILAASNYAVLAAKATTKTIPIVFVGGFDPVEIGAVVSLARPGGNITGASFFANALEGKRLGLLRVLVPRVKLIGVLHNPSNASARSMLRDIGDAARTLGVELHLVPAQAESELDRAFADLVKARVEALHVATDGMFVNNAERIVALASQHRIPAVYHTAEYMEAGGLMAYFSKQTDAYREAGVYTGRILRGAKPADLPVILPTKFELVINLRTAKALGLTVPEGLTLAADEVIE